MSIVRMDQLLCPRYCLAYVQLRQPLEIASKKKASSVHELASTSTAQSWVPNTNLYGRHKNWKLPWEESLFQQFMLKTTKCPKRVLPIAKQVIRAPSCGHLWDLKWCDKVIII